MPVGFYFLPFIQLGPLDPSSYTPWGIMGILAFVIVVLGGIIWKLFVQSTTNQQVRDKIIMDFVDRHRSETHTTMVGIGEKVAQSYDKSADKMAASNDTLRVTMERYTKIIDEMLTYNRVVDKVRAISSTEPKALTPAEIELIARAVRDERKGPA